MALNVSENLESIHTLCIRILDYSPEGFVKLCIAFVVVLMIILTSTFLVVRAGLKAFYLDFHDFVKFLNGGKEVLVDRFPVLKDCVSDFHESKEVLVDGVPVLKGYLEQGLSEFHECKEVLVDGISVLKGYLEQGLSEFHECKEVLAEGVETLKKATESIKKGSDGIEDAVKLAKEVTTKSFTYNPFTGHGKLVDN